MNKKTFSFFRKLTKNKGVEIQLTLNKFLFGGRPAIFSLSFDYTTKQDHAGINFNIQLLKLIYFDINFYDFRHWDDDTNDWCKYDDVD